MNWNDFWNPIRNYFESNAWNILGFFCTLVIGAILIKIVMMLLRRFFKKREVDRVAARFMIVTVRFILWLVLILILLAMLGVPVTGLTTAFSAAVLAIGMALKEFLSNVAAGLILVSSKKYKTGDYIICESVEGSIVDVNFLFTTLKTPNSTQVTLPNSTMVNSPVTNLGAYSLRRVAITLSVAYESDTNLVRKTVLDVIHSCGKVREDPEPLCRLKNYGAYSLDFFVTCFCDTSDYWDVYYYLMDHFYDEFKRVGIVIPFQQIEIRQREDNPEVHQAYQQLPEREEKIREKKRKKINYEDLESMTLKEFSAHIKQQHAEKKAEEEKKKARKAAKKSKKKAVEEKVEPTPDN